MRAVRWSPMAIAIASVPLIATSQSARAQPEPASVDATPAVEARLELVGGIATAPFITMDLPRTSGNGAALLFATRVQVRPSLDIGARVPLALVHVEQPAGSFVSEGAWGNLELFVEHSHAFGSSRPWFVRARLAVGAPLAEHGSSGFMENRALAIADALLAWRERELFVPGVVPITPAAELALPFQRWSAHATLEVPVLVRVSHVTAEGTTHAVGLAPVLGLGARADITSRLHVSAGAYAVFDLVPPMVWAEQRSHVQASANADLAWRVADGIRLGATVLVPLGGVLGGDTIAAGISLTHTR